MGYLNKATITVDAILTNRGRELLAQGTGTGNFNITKFAVADDEIDYRLYRVDHPNGSTRYGSIIENMPVLEATPDETQIMRYKLVTIDSTIEGQVVIPQIVNIGYESLRLDFTTRAGRTKTQDIEPKTTYTQTQANQPETEYTLSLADGSLAEVEILTAAPGGPTGKIAVNSRGSVVARGRKFKLTALNKSGTTTVSIFGGESGAVYSFSLQTVA